ncbi:MAG TPA: fatty acid desaturase [Thermoleophilaceae bacterium]|nr:fatty acid desaturase [Thermoleophilaceae bacterium]
MRRSTIDVLTSMVPYVALTAAMYLALDVSYLLTLALAVPTAGFLVRTFIVFHDCGHGSFLPSRRGNTWVGVIAGVFVFSPFHAWKHEHAIHHATSSDLDRRGVGDVDTWTVREYAEAPLRARLGYRFMRNPFVMLGLGPFWAMAIEPRWSQGTGRPLDRRSVIGTDILLFATIAALVWLVGWQAYLMVQLPVILLAGGSGIFLFYVQHQFEDVYWQRGDDWSYAEAALKGASYLKLPKVLQFFSGNIGLHHVHHLSARVPNYNLQAAHDDNEFFHDVPTLTLWDGIKTLRFRLYDEDGGRMVTFAGARQALAREAVPESAG